ncbi:MAG: mannose-1-phosphate guanylyltransferase/mannose-6-phosphate isomerase [Rhodocyclales bacterium]|nr:mannose-1-phosphate guanylyltransferase/mannose-6-phosphate isomerase [Rhodocyclales bacterium]
MQLLPVILSGGSGTRLWPLSREQYPKQLLPLVGADSLLQATVRRLDGLTEVADPLLVCNEEHRFVVAEQVRLLGRKGSVLLEPVGRNTAPALTLAALWALDRGSDPVLVVMPADHVILDGDAFRTAVGRAATLAEAGQAVTFGITPDCPETGYGYIQQGKRVDGDAAAFALARFVEKPDRATAQAYLDSGDYLWNSGIFVMKASVWKSAIGLCRPDILAACGKSLAGATIDGDFVRVAKQEFAACPSDSIDYAVMERITAGVAGLPKAAVIPLAAGWSDVGAWDSLWQVLPKDAAGNAFRGDVMLHETSGTLAFSESRLVACVGVCDLVVVETPDAVLVAHKDRTQDVKKIAERLKRESRSEAQLHRKVERPWGSYDGVDAGERFQVKRIVVKPGASLSLQMHHHRAEHWIVVRGTAKVTRGEETLLVTENQSTFIPLGTRHRLENPGKVPLEMIEVQSGSYLGEDDIVRFEDHYGRN